MRQFIQPVAIKMKNLSDQAQMRQKLVIMGYDCSGFDLKSEIGVFPFILAYYGGESSRAGNNQNPAQHDKGRIVVDDPDLFLALAAMSDGEKYYPGEWVICEDDRELDIIKKGRAYKIKYANDRIGYLQFKIDIPGENMLLADRFRKATKDDITAHFSQENLSSELTIKSSAIQNPYDPTSDLLPRNKHEAERILALQGAITRLINRSQSIPQDWVNELNDLLWNRIERQEP